MCTENKQKCTYSNLNMIFITLFIIDNLNFYLIYLNVLVNILLKKNLIFQVKKKNLESIFWLIIKMISFSGPEIIQ